MPAKRSKGGAGTERARKPGIRVLIVDDHLSFGEALRTVLDLEKDLVVVDVVTDGPTAVTSSHDLHPDVVIMDLAMPGMDGIETTRRIKQDEPDARVIVLSGQEAELTVGRAMQAGAAGYLNKTQAVANLAGAVRRAYKGEPLMDDEEVDRALRKVRHRRAQESDMATRLERLTPRELEILQLLADGSSIDTVAKELGLSKYTLRTHVQNVLTKLRVHSKLDAVVTAIRYGKITAVTPQAPKASAEEPGTDEPTN